MGDAYKQCVECVRCLEYALPGKIGAFRPYEVLPF